MAMQCPGCGTEMGMIEVHSIEIDRCPGCGGILLDKGETEMIDTLGIANVIEGGVTVPSGETRPTPAHCYACKVDMIALRGAGNIEYDWCENCERLFFDRGELSELDAFIDV
jgi:Zn-finger nucleic acid-binding protein|nr:zf-TFIIB domain-containing protein [Kofleriaceae bacterium]